MLRAIQSGKHIFSEKLLAPTVAEASEIVAAADDAGLALVVSRFPGSTTDPRARSWSSSMTGDSET